MNTTSYSIITIYNILYWYSMIFQMYFRNHHFECQRVRHLSVKGSGTWVSKCPALHLKQLILNVKGPGTWVSTGPAIECQGVRQSNVKGSGKGLSEGLAKVCRRVWQRFVGGSVKRECIAFKLFWMSGGSGNRM